jgi:pilus assembly protein CpaE
MADMIKVLIVDDIPETREMLRKLLAFEPDIEVLGAASTGREGLQIAAESRPDIVLMDINMPDMDGITATEEIKKIVPSAGVIMMSVQSEADYLRRAMLAGARDFLTKPISGEDLYQTIRRVYDLMEVDRGRPVAGVGSNTKSKIQGAGGHIIAVYSPQGGSGVTTIATNMAIALMREGTRVLLVDADLQFGDVGVFLNLQAKYTLADLAESASDLEIELVDQMTVTHPSQLRVLLAPRTPDEAERVAPADLTQAIKTLATFYDFVIVDLSKRLDDVTLNIMDIAKRIVLVATPTLPAVKNIRAILDLFRAMEYPEDKVMFVMNRVASGMGRAAIPVEAIENNLKWKIHARIPLDEKVFLSAVNQGVSVIATEPGRSPASDLIALAEAVRRSLSKNPQEDDMPTLQQAPKKQQGRLSIFGRG